MTKPRSWKEVLSHPDIDSIEDNREEAKRLDPTSDDMEIWVNLKDDAENPVTGEMGAGFYAGDMRDVIDLLYWD